MNVANDYEPNLLEMCLGATAVAIAAVFLSLMAAVAVAFGVVLISIGIGLLFICGFVMACLHICGVDIRSWIDSNVYGKK